MKSAHSTRECQTSHGHRRYCQAVRKHAIKLQHTPDNIVGARGSSGIREWNGRFSQVVSKLLEARGLKAWLKGDYVNRCEPALRAVFSPGVTSNFFIQASKVALDVGDKADWIRCERRTSVSPRNPLIGDNCGYCGGIAKLIDPASDAVFRSRKAFYRRLWERLSNKDDGYAPHQLIAEEHSAALNDFGMPNAMSRNEAYELRFQDIPIEQDGQVGSPIDILSCTTTMEVGIDIGMPYCGGAPKRAARPSQLSATRGSCRPARRRAFHCRHVLRSTATTRVFSAIRHPSSLDPHPIQFSTSTIPSSPDARPLPIWSAAFSRIGSTPSAAVRTYFRRSAASLISWTVRRMSSRWPV